MKKEPQKFVILRNMKCGSTAISQFLNRNGRIVNNEGLMGNFIGHHSIYRTIREFLPMHFSLDEIEEFTWVSSVREPVARAESAYAHLANKRNYPDPDEWVMDCWMNIPTDEEVLNGLRIPNLKVFRVEKLNDEMHAWADKMKFRHKNITIKNSRAQRESQSDFQVEFELQDSTKQALREKWSWTFENFYALQS